MNMVDTTAEFIFVGVDYVIAATLIAAMLSILTALNSISMVYNERNALSSALREYRLHNQFDNTSVYAQDIIAQVVRDKGIPFTSVQTGIDTKVWNGTAMDVPGEKEESYNLEYVAGEINSNVLYKATLVKDAGGSVIGYDFIEQ